MRGVNAFPTALLTGLIALCAALFLALWPSSARAVACPNEAVRAEQGAAALALPDCRAYELASPGSTPSISAERIAFGGGKAAAGGNALSYYSAYPAEESSVSSETWLTRRTQVGWTVVSLVPQMTPTPSVYGPCQPGVALSEGLDAHLLSAGGDLPSSEAAGYGGECGVPAEELVLGEPRGYSNLYLSKKGDPYALVNPVPLGETPGNATYQAASSDLDRVVFSEDAQLAPGAPPGLNLYEWVDGIVRLVGVLPNGDPVSARLGADTRAFGTESGWLAGLAPVSHAVSDDGERVFFQAGGNLYLRENAGQVPAADANCRTTSEAGLGCTLQIDVSKGAGSSGGGVFQFASRDGSRVFFTSDHALTFPSSAEAGKPDLYEYNLDAEQIVDLTVAVGEAANVRGISGGADDGSRLYFVARGVLTGTQQNGQGEVAQSGQPNLYVAEDGALTYVATLSTWGSGGGVDKYNWWESDVGRLKTAWGGSGGFFVLSSKKPLTGFDSTPAEPGLCAEPPCEELFLYDAGAKELSCISCDPEGGKPLAHTQLTERQEFKRFTPGPRYAPRAVLDTGQVFFDTKNPLVPGDVNGAQDVYEFHAGKLSLISSGHAEGNSIFIDASTDGRDVFFATPESLVRSDDDGGLPSIYDARADGGFVEPPLPPAPCVGEECRPPGGALPLPAGVPSTAGFTGPGNIKTLPCKHGKVRRGKKCVRKKHRHHRHHQANKNRGND